MRVCLAASSLLLATVSTGDTSVSRHWTSVAESNGPLGQAHLIVYDMRAEDSPGRLSLTCVGHVPGIGLLSATPEIVVLAFGSRRSDRQEQVSVENVKLRIDRNPHHEVSADVRDNPGGARLDDDSVMRPYTAAETLLLATEAREFVKQLSQGQRLIAQIGNVQPVVHLDLATAHPDIVQFNNACDRMHTNFQQSPQRWAAMGEMDQEIDPFTDRGHIRLQLHHETSHDGGAQAMLFVQCGNDNDHDGVDVMVLVPPEFHDEDVPSGTESDVTLRFDSDHAQRVKLKATARGMDDDVWWDTSELPGEEQPSRDLLKQLRTASTMVVQGFGLPPLRFDLAGGRPAIAEFAGLCDAMLD